MELAEYTKTELEKILKYAERRTEHYLKLSQMHSAKHESQSKRTSCDSQANTHSHTNQAK